MAGGKRGRPRKVPKPSTEEEEPVGEVEAPFPVLEPSSVKMEEDEVIEEDFVEEDECKINIFLNTIQRPQKRKKDISKKVFSHDFLISGQPGYVRPPYKYVKKGRSKPEDKNKSLFNQI